MREVVRHPLMARLGRVLADAGRVDGPGLDVHARARAPQVHPDQRHRQRHRGHGLEIDQRLDRHPARAPHVAHPGDAVDDGAEDHRRDDHPDQGDEEVAQRLHRRPQVGLQPAQQGARSHGEQDLEPQLAEQAREHRPGLQHRGLSSTR